MLHSIRDALRVRSEHGGFSALHAALHEDLERLERLIVKDYKQDVKGYKDKLMQNHRVRKRLDAMQDCANKLVRQGGGGGPGVHGERCIMHQRPWPHSRTHERLCSGP